MYKNSIHIHTIIHMYRHPQKIYREGPAVEWRIIFLLNLSKLFGFSTDFDSAIL